MQSRLLPNKTNPEMMKERFPSHRKEKTKPAALKPEVKGHLKLSVMRLKKVFSSVVDSMGMSIEEDVVVMKSLLKF